MIFLTASKSVKSIYLVLFTKKPFMGNQKFENVGRNLPRVIAPTTKPWAATRMWIRWTDILVFPLLFNLYNPYATIAAKPAIPVKEIVTSYGCIGAGNQDEFIINQCSVFYKDALGDHYPASIQTEVLLSIPTPIQN